jgi:hypothetical protein
MWLNDMIKYEGITPALICYGAIGHKIKLLFYNLIVQLYWHAGSAIDTIVLSPSLNSYYSLVYFLLKNDKYLRAE